MRFIKNKLTLLSLLIIFSPIVNAAELTGNMMVLNTLWVVIAGEIEGAISILGVMLLEKMRWGAHLHH